MPRKTASPTEAATEPTAQLAVRLPVTLIDRIEKHVARLRRNSPGIDVRRADAIRALLIDAVSRAEQTEPS